MTRPLADSVFETTQTAGTGPLSLAGASAGYRRFRDAFPSGATVAYVIQQARYAGETLTTLGREIGLGRLTHGAPDLLSRDVVLTQHGGAAAGGKLRIEAGGADVYVAAPAVLYRLGARTVAGNVALGVVDVGTLILATAGAGGITVTLPLATRLPPGVDVGVVKVDDGAGDVNVQGAGGARIGDGSHRETTGDRWRLARYTWTGAVWLSDVDPPSGLPAATAAQTLAGARSDVAVTPAALDGAGMTPKAWALMTEAPAGGQAAISIHDSHGVRTIDWLARGTFRFTWTRPFANANYIVAAGLAGITTQNPPGVLHANYIARLNKLPVAASAEIKVLTTTGNTRPNGVTRLHVLAFGEVA